MIHRYYMDHIQYLHIFTACTSYIFHTHTYIYIYICMYAYVHLYTNVFIVGKPYTCHPSPVWIFLWPGERAGDPLQHSRQEDWASPHRGLEIPRGSMGCGCWDENVVGSWPAAGLKLKDEIHILLQNNSIKYWISKHTNTSITSFAGISA